MLRKNFLSEFFFALMDMRVKLVPVFSDRELLVIINRDKYFLVADWLFIWVVELSNIRVL